MLCHGHGALSLSGIYQEKSDREINLYFVGVMRKMFFQSVTQEAKKFPVLPTGIKTFDILVTNPDALLLHYWSYGHLTLN